MRFFQQNNNIMMGLLLGATVPVLAYMGVELIFELLTDAGIMDELTESTIGKRQRTTAVIALCFNIVTVQFFKSRRYDRIINGIVGATLIYAIAWLLIFIVL